MNRLVFALLLALVAARGARAADDATARAADDATILVLQPSDASPIVAEALARLRAEITAAGYRPVMVTLPAQLGGRSVAALVATHDAIGAVALLEAGAEARGGHVDLLAYDRDSETTLTRSVNPFAGASNPAALVAVRAVELLRAGLLERRQAAATLEPAVAPAPRALDTLSFRLDVGAAALHSAEGALGPALAPSAFAGLGLRRTSLLVGFVGPAAAIERTGSVGSAQVRQALALLEAQHDLRDRATTLVPFVNAGVAALRVALTGDGISPYVGDRHVLWTPAAAVGAGITLRLTSALVTTVAIRAMFATRSPELLIGDERLGRIGRASAVATVSLGARL